MTATESDDDDDVEDFASATSKEKTTPGILDSSGDEDIDHRHKNKSYDDSDLQPPEATVTSQPIDEELLGLLRHNFDTLFQEKMSSMEGELQSMRNSIQQQSSTDHLELQLKMVQDDLRDSQQELQQTQLELLRMKRQSSVNLLTDHSLPQDTFLFLVTSGLDSVSFWFSVIVYAFQMATFVLVIFNLLQNGEGPKNPFGIPGNVGPELRSAQFIAIVIAAFIHEDILTAAVLFRDGYNTMYPQSFPAATPAKFWLSTIARFTEGCLGLVVSFLLIVTAESVIELLLNFTAIAFISNLDEIMFALSKLGFMGRRCKKQASDISAAKFKAEKHHGRLWKIILLLVTMGTMIVGWAAVINSQVNGYFFCNTVLVQFGDDFRPDLGAFSGLYDLETPPASLFSERRVVYVERLPDPTSRQRKARFVYCGKLGSWAFQWDDGVDAAEQDPCNYVARSTPTDTFDLMATSTTTWFVRDTNKREVVLNPFYLTCFECTGSDDECGGRGVCIDAVCDCNNGYGLRCELPEPCQELVVDIQTRNFTSSRGWSNSYNLLYDSERNAAAESNHRPVYVHENDSGDYDIIVYLGRRWGLTSSSTPGIDATNLARFFADGFHAHSPDLSFAFLSEPADIGTPNDAFSPEQLQWFHATSRNQNSYNISSFKPGTSIDTQLVCRQCSIGNPCQYDGVCLRGGCQCGEGKELGDLCQVPPTANGFCNSFFNTPEFSFDGGDCCEHTCKSTKDYKCGYGASRSFYVGYPSCKMAANEWYTHGDELVGDPFSQLGAFVALSSSGAVLGIAEPGRNRIRLFDKDGSKWSERREALDLATQSSQNVIRGLSISTGLPTLSKDSTVVAPVLVAVHVTVETRRNLKLFLCEIQGCRDVGNFERADAVSVSSDGSTVAIATNEYWNHEENVEVPNIIQVLKRSGWWDDYSESWNISYQAVETLTFGDIPSTENPVGVNQPTSFPSALEPTTLPAVFDLPSVPPTVANRPALSTNIVSDASEQPNPKTHPGGFKSVLVESRLEYRFFDGVEARPATQEEIDGLLVETKRFYTNLTFSQYPNLVSFYVRFLDNASNEGNHFSIQIEFDAYAIFHNDPGAIFPTTSELVALLENADYTDYLSKYVWEAEPKGGTIFFDTQQVLYNARKKGASNSSPAVLPIDSTLSNSPIIKHILVESRLEYGFFDGAEARPATQEEIDGVLAQTRQFYADLLSALFPNFMSFDATFLASAFRPGNYLPILIDFDANAFFIDGENILTASELLDLMDSADYQYYITSYVWESEPEGNTIFFDTLEVLYNARVTPEFKNWRQKPPFFDLKLSHNGDSLAVLFNSALYEVYDWDTGLLQHYESFNSTLVQMRWSQNAFENRNTFGSAASTVFNMPSGESVDTFVMADDGNSIYVNLYPCGHRFYEWSGSFWEGNPSPFQDIATCARVHAVSFDASTCIVEDTEKRKLVTLQRNGASWNEVIWRLPDGDDIADLHVSLSNDGSVLAVGMPKKLPNNAGAASVFSQVQELRSGQSLLRVSISPYTKETSWLLHSSMSGELKMEGSSEDLHSLLPFTNATIVSSKDCLVFTIYPSQLHCEIQEHIPPDGVCNVPSNQGRFDLLLGNECLGGMDFGKTEFDEGETTFLFQPYQQCDVKVHPPLRYFIGQCPGCESGNRFQLAVIDCHEAAWTLSDGDQNIVASSNTTSQCGKRERPTGCVTWTAACVDTETTCYTLTIIVAAVEDPPAVGGYPVFPFYAYIDEEVVASSWLTLGDSPHIESFTFGKCQPHSQSTNSPSVHAATAASPLVFPGHFLQTAPPNIPATGIHDFVPPGKTGAPSSPPSDEPTSTPTVSIAPTLSNSPTIDIDTRAPTTITA